VLLQVLLDFEKLRMGRFELRVHLWDARFRIRDGVVELALLLYVVVEKLDHLLYQFYMWVLDTSHIVV
jgi:hypothetical protein